MEEASVDMGSLDPAQARRCVLERVRFELSMGVEFLPRVQLAPSIAVPVSVTVQQAAPAVRVAPAIPATAAVPVAPVRSTSPIGPVRPISPVPVVRPVPAAPAQQPIARPPLAAPAARVAPNSILTKEQRWSNLEARALACVKCVLHEGRTNVVFGSGDRAARLVFVGEGPGQDEDLQGLPFVGKAGQLLTKIIAAMGYTRDQVYICNVVKCRPPGNRTPLPDEVAACSPYLFEQIELVAPKAIVALGGPAAQTLLNTTVGITKLRGNWYSYKSIPVMPTFHPAFVLRQYTEEVRRQVWEDMKKVMEKLKT